MNEKTSNNLDLGPESTGCLLLSGRREEQANSAFSLRIPVNLHGVGWFCHIVNLAKQNSFPFPVRPWFEVTIGGACMNVEVDRKPLKVAGRRARWHLVHVFAAHLPRWWAQRPGSGLPGPAELRLCFFQIGSGGAGRDLASPSGHLQREEEGLAEGPVRVRAGGTSGLWPALPPSSRPTRPGTSGEQQQPNWDSLTSLCDLVLRVSPSTAPLPAPSHSWWVFSD